MNVTRIDSVKKWRERGSGSGGKRGENGDQRKTRKGETRANVFGSREGEREKEMDEGGWKRVGEEGRSKDCDEVERKKKKEKKKEINASGRKGLIRRELTPGRASAGASDQKQAGQMGQVGWQWRAGREMEKWRKNNNKTATKSKVDQEMGKVDEAGGATMWTGDV